MKHTVILLTIFCFFYAELPAQWHYMLPTEDNTQRYDDTLLNKRTTLVREGIRKITIFKDAPEGKKKAFKHGEKIFDATGNIISTNWCWRKISNYDSVICLKDSFVYNVPDRGMTYLMAVAPNGSAGATFKTEWISDSISKTTAIVPVLKDPSTPLGTKQETRMDTSHWYSYYNRLGQLSSIFSEMGDTSYVSYFDYYTDGLLAMVSDDKTKSILKRTEKDGDIILKHGSPPFLFQWTFNENKQCTAYLFKYNNGLKKYDIQVTYAYNKQGLLSRVNIAHSERPEMKYYYSYSK